MKRVGIRRGSSANKGEFSLTDSDSRELWRSLREEIMPERIAVPRVPESR